MNFNEQARYFFKDEVKHTVIYKTHKFRSHLLLKVICFCSLATKPDLMLCTKAMSSRLCMTKDT